MTEFWPYGLAHCGSDPLDYLHSLIGLGFGLFELPHKGEKTVVPITDLQAFVSRLHGRKYLNVLGLKGTITTSSVVRQ
jgi:hypothetical protein